MLRKIIEYFKVRKRAAVQKEREEEKEKIEKHFREYACSHLCLWNGGSQCDILYCGPCACGAFHDYDELIRRIDRPGYSTTTWSKFRAECVRDGIIIPEEVAKYDLPGLSRMQW